MIRAALRALGVAREHKIETSELVDPYTGFARRERHVHVGARCLLCGLRSEARIVERRIDVVPEEWFRLGRKSTGEVVRYQVWALPCLRWGWASRALAWMLARPHWLPVRWLRSRVMLSARKARVGVVVWAEKKTLDPASEMDDDAQVAREWARRHGPEER